MFARWIKNISTTKLLSFIYFFLNNWGLPAPVTYTSLLWVLKFKVLTTKYLRFYAILSGIIVLYAIIHFVQGVLVLDYIQSTVFFLVLIASGIVGYHFLISQHIQTEKIFQWLSLMSGLMLLLGVAVFFTPFREVFWTNHTFTGKGFLWRFQALSYEPSHLALTLSPIFLYFFCKLLRKFTVKSVIYLLIVSIPIALTVSFGFGASLAVTVFVLMIFSALNFKRLPTRWGVLSLIGLLGIMAVYLVPNPLSERIDHILAGNDTSVNGRTTEAYSLAWQCAETKNIWFGIGLGQIKYVAEDVIRPYYEAMDPVGYSKENWPVLNIPNAMAETLAIFGITGLVLKIAFQLFCFWKFSLYKNLFNLSLFAFIFSYQMMGSFIFSSTEIMMWVMAFARIYPEFDLNQKKVDL